jgi:hypothetical protein
MGHSVASGFLAAFRPVLGAGVCEKPGAKANKPRSAMNRTII